MAEHLTFEKASRFFASNLTFRLREEEIRDFVNVTSDVFELSGTDEDKCQDIANRFVEALKGNQKPFSYMAGDIPLKLDVDDIARVLVTDAGYKADALDQAINYVQDVWGGYVLDKQKLDFVLDQIHDGLSYTDTFELYQNFVQENPQEVTETSKSYEEAVSQADALFELNGADLKDLNDISLDK